ncbi:MAG TPA: DUF3857 domain-containing protein [Spirochaetota bacterium]|nr:DUF3857 domain-containing protein [Spirochaetota bacterium]HOS32186.1 DUF3857 domain-containing protein [Spirochaetota bacterium]HOS55495.1 DUF3857 domain-containing protein [Spirochaetota bacterium]HPK62808.1 DUF3857 domain-containing protein [Spirochaetota bacterium]HQF78024.1 DUF3857 domain-containing protein [Spirochaetota bacterium]
MKKFSYLLLFVIIVSCVSFGPNSESETKTGFHIIILNNGAEYKGKLISATDKEVVFMINGENRTFNKESVNKIQFRQYREYENVKKVDEIKDRDIQFIRKSSKKWGRSQENGYVTLLSKMSYEILDNNTYRLNIKKGIKILSEDGKKASTQYFYYLKTNSDVKLKYAFTILKDGGISTVDEEAVNDEPINNSYPNYDELRRVKFGLKDVDLESVFVWEAEIVRKIDGLLSPFHIEENILESEPVEKKIIEINNPLSIKLNVKFYDGYIDYPKPNIVRNSKYFSASFDNLPGYVVDEDNIPSYSMILPKAYASLGGDFDAIKENYKNKYFKNDYSDEIKDYSLKYAGVCKNEIETLDKIYDRINRNIELARVPFSQARYTPLDDKTLVNSSYLNVLDKSYYFTRLANALGVNVEMIFYKDYKDCAVVSECPSLRQYDSVLCKYDNGGISLYYSFENQDYSSGQRPLSSNYAEALNISRSDESLTRLDKLNAEENGIEINYICDISGADLTLKRTTTLTGVYQTSWRDKRRLSKEKFENWLRMRTKSLGSDVAIKNYSFLNDLSDYKKEVAFQEEYLIRNFTFSSGENFKFFTMPSIQRDASSTAKAYRRFPYDAGDVSYERIKFVIGVPDGYKFYHYPEDLNVKFGGGVFSGKYSIKDEKLILEISTVYDDALVFPDKYAEYKKWSEETARFCKEWIMIKK